LHSQLGVELTTFCKKGNFSLTLIEIATPQSAEGFGKLVGSSRFCIFSSLIPRVYVTKYRSAMVDPMAQ